MRLKGSYTVENSFIMPFFIIIIVLLLYLCFYIHDVAILKNSALKLAIRAENHEDNYENNWKLSELRQKGIDYMKEKTIFTNNTNVTIENNRNEIKVTCTGTFAAPSSWFKKAMLLSQSATIGKNKPSNFIRIINAVDEIVQEKR